MNLKGDKIFLRALEPQDVDVLFTWENDSENWKVSNTISPFSRFVLEQYIASSHQDIYTTKQLRFVICKKENNESIGTIDLFDFDPLNLRVGVGILIGCKDDRKKGYASEALKIVIDYCFETLNLHQVYCNIGINNESSILLFQQHNFQITGIKKLWNRVGAGNAYEDELTLQLIRK